MVAHSIRKLLVFKIKGCSSYKHRGVANIVVEGVCLPPPAPRTELGEVETEKN